ncbi:DUF6301 family protein [Actinoplanes sp. GCM10030250]|uniref:DUF6301 family protein n=1 Tax=Actinoplanes sp. GCM10030250 TaxID=3273376 RepID=UPI00361CAAAC
MTTWLQGSSEALRSLMAGVRDTKWSWQTSDVEDLCRRMGWTLLEVTKRGSAFADAGLGVPGDQVRMLASDGHVDDISIRITQTVSDGGPERDRFIADAFAGAVAKGVAALGEPTDRQHTEPPTVRWRLDESTVLVKNLEVAVTVTWASNRFQDDWDRIEEALS